MVDLTIYIPTYNRLNKLKNCLRAIRYDLKGYEDRVKIFVSNNGSTDGTKEYLDAQKWIEVSHNSENLGMAANFIYAYNLPIKSKFVWIIGDDDYVIPGSIGELLVLTNYDVDYIYCNTMAFSPDDAGRVWEAFPNVPMGQIKGKYEGIVECKFVDLIDPNVADTLLGELMVHCFRQDVCRWDKPIEPEETDARTRQAHNVPLIECFNKDTKAVYSQSPKTFNFWGTAEWIGDYDYVFPIIILWLIREYRKFVSEEKYFALLQYYIDLMGGSITRQMEGKTKARPFNESFKDVLNRIFEEYKQHQDA
jgi:glycosyltransferase involved in cell wall biosynthesis